MKTLLIATAFISFISTTVLTCSASATCKLQVRNTVKTDMEAYAVDKSYSAYITADILAAAKTFDGIQLVKDRNYTILPDTSSEATLGVVFGAGLFNAKNTFGETVYNLSYYIAYYKDGSRVKITLVPDPRSIMQYLLDDLTALNCTL